MQQATHSPLEMTLHPAIHSPVLDARTALTGSISPGMDLIAQVNKQLYTEQLGLQTSSGFVPVPVSLTPWQLSSAQFARAQRLAQLLGQIQSKAAANPQWLLTLLSGLKQSKTVPGQIWRTLRSIYPDGAEQTAALTLRATPNLMLNRHDFLLNQQQQWKWVESNPIAAGMGPLNERYLMTYQRQALQLHCPFAPNNAIASQAKLLADAALSSVLSYQSATSGEPLMLIVVEEDEDNIFDQQLLCDEVKRLGVRVERVTIKQLLQSEFDDNDHLCWQTQRVGLIYWRTGYNPSPDLNDDFWRFRARLETAAVHQCPALAGQLTGSKWFQHQLTMLVLGNSQGAAAQFALSATDLALLTQAMMPSYAVSELTPEMTEQLITQGYWYKTQQEGGGNVARGQAALDKLINSDSADLLMAPIHAAVRREAFTSLRHGKAIVATEHISELGIFSLGGQALYGGYLCRTKPAQNNEGGVHRGGAVLDTVLLS